MLKRSGGQRQRIWNTLSQAKNALSVNEIIEQVGGEAPSARVYLSGLAQHGYAVKDNGWILVKDTGPEAPAYNSKTGELRDWNIDRPMSRGDLQRAVRQHGGSFAQFCRDIGIHEASSTRLKQMIEGQRPITSNIQNAVQAWRELQERKKAPLTG